MVPCTCSCIFVFLQTSLKIDFRTASVSDTRDTLLVQKMRRENANLLYFVHTALLETNIIEVSYFFL